MGKILFAIIILVLIVIGIALWAMLRRASVADQRLSALFGQPHEWYLADELAKAAYEQEKDKGENALTEAQSTIGLVWGAEGVIDNGGMQYFFECFVCPLKAADAFGRIGMPIKSKAIRDATALFPNNAPSPDGRTRNAERVDIEKRKPGILDELTHAFWAGETPIETYVAKYAIAHRGDINGRYLPEITGGSWFREVRPPMAEANPQETALWLLSISSSIFVRAEGGTEEQDEYVSGIDKLPQKAFCIVGIGLDHNRSTTDRDLIDMSRLKALNFVERIDLDETGVTRAGLQTLSHWIGLRKLFLARTRLIDEDLDLLPSLPKLERMTLSGRRLTENAIRRLGRFPSLTKVDFGRIKATDSIMECLSAMSELTELTLDGADISQIGLGYLGRMTKLKELSLHGLQLPDEAFLPLGNLAEMESLSLSKCGVGDKTMKQIGKMHKLHFLSITRCPVGNADLLQLADLVKMEDLRLFETDAGDSGLEGLRNMSQLKYLSLSDCKVKGSGLAHLATLPKLQTLSLCRCPLSASAGEYLGRISALESLSLDETPFDDIALKGLRGIPISRAWTCRKRKYGDKAWCISRHCQSWKTWICRGRRLATVRYLTLLVLRR